MTPVRPVVERVRTRTRRSRTAAKSRPARPGCSGLWLGLAALLLQTLIPFSQAVPVPWRAGADRHLLHCLVAHDRRDGREPAVPAPMLECPLCQLCSLGKSTLPALASSIVAASAHEEHGSGRREHLPQHRLKPTLALPRGPPASRRSRV